MDVNRSSTIETEALPLRKQARKTLSRKFWVATIAIAGTPKQVVARLSYCNPPETTSSAPGESQALLSFGCEQAISLHEPVCLANLCLQAVTAR
jgi:hypothetical protein